MDWFYVGSALVLMVIVAVGFAPSFYFRYARELAGAQLSFCASLVAHDRVTMRRVHPGTIWGVAAHLLVGGASVSLAFSELGHRLVNALV